jgi:arginine exporter protein ArgO
MGKLIRSHSTKTHETHKTSKQKLFVVKNIKHLRFDSLTLVLFCSLQKIDGFLAILSIAGGNISPKSQKLPFSVTSVGDDCFLLYYASIDLSGGSLPSKLWGQKLKTNQNKSDAQTINKRLRIPMKGRIQLVPTCLFAYFS